MEIESRDTIAAISTPIGYGGIGVVRISGADAKNIARKIFKPGKSNYHEAKKTFSKEANPFFSSRRVQYGYVLSEDGKGILDEALMIYMPAPHSYTREDVVEIQAHAGPITLHAILEAVIESGARLADPGEFTRRAYTSGRIDLSQAEAVIDVIQAKTKNALKMASRQLEGAVGRSTKSIKERLISLMAMLEAEIEFPEEVEGIDEQRAFYLRETLDIQKAIEKIIDGYRKGHFIREGLRLIIVGKVNVGKSSLLNRFLDKERALVTEHPGTTRDSIEETINIYGLPVVLIDTAGWRNTTDPVERLGIDRTRNLAQSADLILFMMDADRGIVSEDMALYDRIRNKEKIIVINKMDLLKGENRIDVPREWNLFSVNYTAVKYDQGIEELKDAIYRFGTQEGLPHESEIIPNIRQKKLFQAAYHALGAARRVLEENQLPELAAVDFQQVMDALDEITGASVRTDVLDTVFSRFCIGK